MLLYKRLTVWLTEDPWTEVLCSWAGKGLCKLRGIQWVCVLCLHTEDKTVTQQLFISSFLCGFLWDLHMCITLYVLFEPQHIWPSRGRPAPPRAPWRSQLLDPLLPVSGAVFGSVLEIGEHEGVSICRRLLEALCWLNENISSCTGCDILLYFYASAVKIMLLLIAASRQW